MLKGVGVGTGYFAQFHYEAWQRLPGVELMALCDLDQEKAEAMAARFGIQKVYTDLTKMLDQEQPDFLDIITPPNTHLELLQIAADRKIPVICQKPLAPTLGEAEAMVQLAEKAGIRLMVHENWRFQPWYRKIHQLINEGAIGDKFYQLYFRMRMGDGWPEDAYLSRQPYFRTMPRLLMYETGIHFIDTFRFLLGEVKQVFAKLKRLNPNIVGEDAAMVWFDFANGTQAVLDANRYNESKSADPRYTFGELLLETNTGSLRLYDTGQLSWQALGQKEQIMEYPHQKLNFAGDCVYTTQQHFLQAMENDLPFETNAQDYLENLRVQEAVYQSNETGKPIRLGRES